MKDFSETRCGDGTIIKIPLPNQGKSFDMGNHVYSNLVDYFIEAAGKAIKKIPEWISDRHDAGGDGWKRQEEVIYDLLTHTNFMEVVKDYILQRVDLERESYPRLKKIK